MAARSWRQALLAVVVLHWTGVAAFSETPPDPVPSDPASRYFVLEQVVGGWGLTRTLLVKRVGPDGARYFQLWVDCEEQMGERGPEAVSISGARSSRPTVEEPLAGPTVSGDLSREYCRDSLRLLQAEKRKQTRLEIQRWTRAEALRPRRREGPARPANITAAEVQEIQAVARDLAPGAMVNIGAVVSGCPCEDGPACTDQVWVVSFRPDKSTGLLLSRIANQWTIGPVQQWWLDYEELLGRPRNHAKDEEGEMYNRFPACASEDKGQ